MKLSTIWTLPGASLHEKIDRTKDWAALKVASRLLPQRVRYWAFISSGVQTIRPDEAVPSVRYVDLLSRMS